MIDEMAVEALRALTTPHLADACLRAEVPVRCAPPALRPVHPGMRCAGRALPARVCGSVDVIFEALQSSHLGDVLVVDNGGRLDEACVGDLVTLEVSKAGLAGILAWGLHRDTDELREIGLPVFSLGPTPTGPQRSDPRSPNSLESARVGTWVITVKDFVVCDSDGALFLPADKLSEIVKVALSIKEAERRHADKMRAGITFREQISFAYYLEKRKSNPTLGFREHLRTVRASIEE